MKTIEDADVVKAFEQRLREELAETIRLIEESKEYRAPVELDQQSVGRLSRMDAMQQQAMAQDITRRRQHRKVSIERALSRIRDGEYGYCSECGEPIAVRRLDKCGRQGRLIERSDHAATKADPVPDRRQPLRQAEVRL